MPPEFTGQRQARDKYNLGNLPPEGSEHCGKFFWELWEAARKEKVDRLGLHDRFLELHEKWRGKVKVTNSKYRSVALNSFFRTAHTYCAVLTEKTPIAEVNSDQAPPEQSQALNSAIDLWWGEEEGQNLLWASTQNMIVYGTTIEKHRLDVETDAYGRILDINVQTIIKDPFEIFPAPGFKMAELKRLPYLCDAYTMPAWEVRRTFGIADEVEIRADAEEQLFGKSRETTRGGLQEKGRGRDNLPSNYAVVGGQGGGEHLKDHALVVEIWVKDDSIAEEPVQGQVQAQFDNGQPATDDFGKPIMQEAEVRTTRRFIYPDKVRKVVVCNQGDLVLDDTPNPNINWELVKSRAAELLDAVQEVPVIDPQTGQPTLNPMTGQPVTQKQPIVQGADSAERQEIATDMALEQARKAHLWGKFPYIVAPAIMDTSQWWGFSIYEMFEALHSKTERLLNKLIWHSEKTATPMLLLPKTSGVNKNEITNIPGLILEPTTAQNGISYVQVPGLTDGTQELLQTLMMMEDIISMTPEVTEGRRPTGVSAASAIAILQDKAATAFQPFVRTIDRIIRERGRMYISFQREFGTQEKPVRLANGNEYALLGIALLSDFEFSVESGSSAPITKSGRRAQYVELFKLGAMDLESLLEMLEIPKAKQVVERLTEQNSLAKAMQILVQAGMPPEMAQQIFGWLMQAQTMPQPGKAINRAGGGQQSPEVQAENSTENAARFSPPGGLAPTMGNIPTGGA